MSRRPTRAPETALTRMRWALTAVTNAFGGSRAEPTHAPYLATTPCPAPPVPHEPPPGAPRHATRPLTATGHGPAHERGGDAHRCSYTSSVSPRGPGHRPHPRQPRDGETGRARPRAAGRHRLPDRAGQPPAMIANRAGVSHVVRSTR